MFLVELPEEVRPDLAERYRQMRPFDEAEFALVKALTDRPHRLDQRHEHTLRIALNLARLWIIGNAKNQTVIGPYLSKFRALLKPLAKSITNTPQLDLRNIAPECERLVTQVLQARHQISKRHGNISIQDIDKELTQKSLVLVVGGGAGCGYIHLGAFSFLESIGIQPALLVGSSIGSILSLFRARDKHFQRSATLAVTHQLSYRRMFRILDAETRYAMPGALRLHLRSSLARFFVSQQGQTMKISDLEIPFISVVTGLKREAMRDVQRYERMFLNQLRKGTLSRFVHIMDLVQNISSLLQELYLTPGALTPVPLGSEPNTQEFDVIDAVGFSAAVPAIIQYDITRDDPRMHALMRSTLKQYDVDVFADGGLVANVPARMAWEHVQSGHLNHRNAFILGLDCFSPQFDRNMLFLPIQRVAALNVSKHKAFTHMMFRYSRVMSATNLVPQQKTIAKTMKQGEMELSKHTDFLKKMMEKLTIPSPSQTDLT